MYSVHPVSVHHVLIHLRRMKLLLIILINTPGTKFSMHVLCFGRYSCAACVLCYKVEGRIKLLLIILGNTGDQVVHVFRPLIGCGMCCPALPSSWCLLIMRPKAGETHFGREGNQLDLKISTFYTFRNGMQLRIVPLSIYSICCDIQRWKIYLVFMDLVKSNFGQSPQN